MPRDPRSIPTMLLRSFVLAALAAASASAQVSYFGQPCAGASGPQPVLAVDGLPVDSEPIELVVTGPAGATGLVFGGVQALPQPLPLGDLGLPGCSLLVYPNAVQPIALDAAGEVRLELKTWTEGLELFTQAFVHDADATTLGATTRAASIRSLGSGGAVLVSEILKDPDFVGDAQGEWIELFNRTDADVDVEGWTLRDDGFDAVVLDNGGAGIVVPAGGYATLGNGADPLTNGGLQHAWVYTGFTLENGADEVVLEDASGALVHRVAYDDGLSWPDAIGASLALDGQYLHTHYAALPEHWSPATCDVGGVPFNLDHATPGGPNDECDVSPPAPPTGEVLFSEVMQNPKAVFDDVGEWFELHNTTGQAIDLAGWTLLAGGIEVIGASVVIPAGGYVLLAASGDAATNGGLPAPDYVWGEAVFLGNGTETLQLYDPGFALVGEVAYDNGGAFPDPNGRAMVLDPDLLTIDDALSGASWCEATSVYGDGDRGTPGAPNDECF